MEYQALRFSLASTVAELTLLRPEIDLRLLRELDDVAAGLCDRAEARVLLVHSAAVDFGTGWSADALSELTGAPSGSSGRPLDPFSGLTALPLPVVFALHGAVHSAALELALVGDIRLATDNARFAMPETEQGLLPLAGGTQRLARLAGRGTALAMLLAGEELDAATARRAGLVSSVLSRETLLDEARRLAATIAARGPIATRLAKEAVRRGADLPLDEALRIETDLSVILQTTADRDEGVRAFREKRPPRFEGR